MESIISLLLLPVPDCNVEEILENWTGFCSTTEALLLSSNGGNLSSINNKSSEFVSQVHSLSTNYNYALQSLVQQHFFHSLQVAFEQNCVSRFWHHFDAYIIDDGGSMLMNDESGFEEVLCKALEELSLEKQHQERSLLMLAQGLQSHRDSVSDDKIANVEGVFLFTKYQLMVSSLLMASLPSQFPVILHQYFKGRLEEISTLMDGGCQHDEDLCVNKYMDLDESFKSSSGGIERDIDEHLHPKKISENNSLVKKIGMVVQYLRSLGLTAMTEDAYASAIFLLLKDKVQDLAGDDYRSSVLDSIKEWIQAVPLRFLHTLLTYLGDSVCPESPASGLKSPLASHLSSFYPDVGVPSEALIRWKLRLEYFAYETLQDIRIAKLFDIIVDYPDSSPAIEDLKQCLDYTGQHSELVDSFISALKYRLLTAGASTNDILLQYVSTIKALRTIDPTGLFIEAVGEPVSDYLRGRKDTIKCIVTMLTDNNGDNSSGGAAGDSLLEELDREEENQGNVDLDDDMNVDDKQAWLNAQRWEPDPVETDPLKGNRNRRKVDILGMIVGIIGSKDQLVNEYRVMLAKKLLDKSDYDIDAEIRTLELLKIHFGETSMQKCEIMLNDFIDSKRINSNIKATIPKPSQAGAVGKAELSLDALDASILSSNFWPQIQDEAIKIPEPVDQLLSDYAKRFHEIKTPRKLIWKKNIGVVKLELQFEDRAVQFSVSPLLASIIMQFQDRTCWTSKDLATAVGVPIDSLNRRIHFWISKGVLTESMGDVAGDHMFTLLEGRESSKSSIHGGGNDQFLVGEEDEDRSVATVEDELLNEATVYENYIIGLLTNFGSMSSDRIHNTLKIVCSADRPYDKSLHQLERFLDVLVKQEKLEARNGMYIVKR